MFTFKEHSQQSTSKTKCPITENKKDEFSTVANPVSLHLNLSSLYHISANKNKPNIKKISLHSKPKPTYLKKTINLSRFPTETYLHFPTTTSSSLQTKKSKQHKSSHSSLSKYLTTNNSYKKFQLFKPTNIKKHNYRETCAEKKQKHKTHSMANLSINAEKVNKNQGDTKSKIEENIYHNMVNQHITNNERANKFNKIDMNLEGRLKDAEKKSIKKHYEILKQSFQDIIKVCDLEQCSFMNKLFSCYGKLISRFLNENKILYNKNIETHKNLNKMNKNLSTCIKQLQEKDKELEELKNIIKNMTFSNGNCLQSFSLKNATHLNKDTNNINGMNCCNCNQKQGKDYNKIIEAFNIQNYTDLDALYFPDKVDMNNKSQVKNNEDLVVPNLKINKEEEEIK